jgi:hypothetical protein
MKKRLLALLIYSVYWLALFFIARLFFILMQAGSSFHCSFGELAGTFSHGFKLDISTTGYYLVLPILILIPGLIFNLKSLRIVIRWYTFFLIVFSTAIIVADANLYSYWGFRMDFTPLLYLKTPGEAMASVSTMKIIVFILTIILMSAFFIFCYKISCSCNSVLPCHVRVNDYTYQGRLWGGADQRRSSLFQQ